jgi:cytochrome c biogenesis protein CcmG/thiol:disulfide interchange protein DsbE
MRQSPTKAARVAIGWALLSGIALQPLPSDAAEQICNADGKLANLNFTFKDAHGKPFTLSDYKGKVVLLDFWATWCPPCRKEIPGFVELYNNYRSRGFVVIGVSMDDSLSDIKKFARRYKMNYPILLGAGRDDLGPAFGQLPLPTAFVLGRDGKICGKHDGLTPKEQFEREIVPLLEVQ